MLKYMLENFIYNGVITPELDKWIEDHAKNPTSPLYGIYDWDTHSPDEKWRLVQSQALIELVKRSHTNH